MHALMHRHLEALEAHIHSRTQLEERLRLNLAASTQASDKLRFLQDIDIVTV